MLSRNQKVQNSEDFLVMKKLTESYTALTLEIAHRKHHHSNKYLFFLIKCIFKMNLLLDSND